tara:strand:- start:846 stop:2447 length:1602 start_codon:yes stop_codon:yes gene_type:complete
MKDNMKDFKDLIKIADVYGTETRDLLEKKEAGQLDEGWWEDLTGFVKKTLGMNDAQAAEIAQDVQKKTGADPEADKPLDITNPKNAGADGPADAPADPAPAPAGLDVTTPNLMKAFNAGGKKAMPSIKAMQQALADAGHDPKGIDGKYGPGTFAAVKAFQQAQGLKADGQAGPNTMKALQGTIKAPAPAAAATGPDGNPTGDPAQPGQQAIPPKPDTQKAPPSAPTQASQATGPDGNPTGAVEPDQASAQASQQGVDAADVAAAGGQAQAGVDGADQAELDAGAGQADDPMSAANQAADRKDKKPKTDRQQMATTEAVNEASMNISMNGTDAREVAELVGILKNAGMEEPKMMAIKALPKMGPMDMDKPSPMGMDRSSPLHSMSSSPCSEDEAEYNALMDEWDNSPDPEYKDDDYMLNDLAGGINRPKKMYPATQPGDNPMAVKEALWKALQEKYTTNEGSRGKKKKIMASRGKMEDTKTTEGSRGKKMKLKASRGEKLNASRGNKLMASRGKDKKTTEGSRGKKSRGKKSRG